MWVRQVLWSALLAVNLVEPGLMFWWGRKLLKSPPRDESRYVSYNTTRARSSREAWDFAQQYSGKVWWNTGAVMMVLAVLIQMAAFLCGGELMVWVWFGMFCVEMVVSAATVIVVEVVLRKNFDENGMRR